MCRSGRDGSFAPAKRHEMKYMERWNFKVSRGGRGRGRGGVFRFLRKNVMKSFHNIHFYNVASVSIIRLHIFVCKQFLYLNGTFHNTLDSTINNFFVMPGLCGTGKNNSIKPCHGFTTVLSIRYSKCPDRNRLPEKRYISENWKL